MYHTLAEITIVPGVIVGEPSDRQKCKFTPEAVCCCCNVGFDMRAIYTVPVDQVLPPDKLTQASYKFFMPEAVCCCLQTCKRGFDIRTKSHRQERKPNQVMAINISLQVFNA